MSLWGQVKERIEMETKGRLATMTDKELARVIELLDETRAIFDKMLEAEQRRRAEDRCTCETVGFCWECRR